MEVRSEIYPGRKKKDIEDVEKSKKSHYSPNCTWESIPPPRHFSLCFFV